MLQTKNLDILYCVIKIENTKDHMKNYCLNFFETLWEIILTNWGNFELSRRRKTIRSIDPKTINKILYYEIFDYIVTTWKHDLTQWIS